MKILLAYDGFERSRHALEETRKLAADGHGEVTVLSVVPPDAKGSKSGGHVGLRPHAHEESPEHMRTSVSAASSQR